MKSPKDQISNETDPIAKTESEEVQNPASHTSGEEVTESFIAKEETAAEQTDKPESAEEKPLVPQPQDLLKKGSERSSKRKTIFKTLGLILIFAIGIYIMLALSKEFDAESGISFGQLTEKIGYMFWIVIIALFIVMLALQAFKFAYLHKISFGRARLGLGLRVNLVGKFYDNITPMASGGQPFQMYYLHKNGVDIGSATSIPTLNYVIQMYAWQLVSLLFLTINGNVLYENAAKESTLILTFCWVGWALNMVAPLLLLSVAFAPKFARWLSRGIVKVGHKIRIVKDYDKTLEHFYNTIDSYRKELIFISKKMGHIVGVFLISILEFLVLLTIPSVLTHFICDTDFTFKTWADMATLYMYSLYGSTFLPTPGASGFAETLSSLAFAGVATEGTLFWLLLMMRFFTYYVFIVLGLAVTLYDMIKGAAVKSRAKKRGQNARPTP